MATQKQQIDSIERKIDEHIEDTRLEHRRLEIMEEKLDKLSEAVVSIARAEEKIAVLVEDTRDIKLAVNENTKKIHELELTTSGHSSELKGITKFFWMVAAAAVTVCATAVGMALDII